MNKIKKIGWITINNKEILVTSNNYNGSPLIAYIPDYLIISKKI